MFLTTVDAEACRCTVNDALDPRKAAFGAQGPVPFMAEAGRLRITGHRLHPGRAY
jgi:hypothetical protein